MMDRKYLKTLAAWLLIPGAFSYMIVLMGVIFETADNKLDWFIGIPLVIGLLALIFFVIIVMTEVVGNKLHWKTKEKLNEMINKYMNATEQYVGERQKLKDHLEKVFQKEMKLDEELETRKKQMVKLSDEATVARVQLENITDQMKDLIEDTDYIDPKIRGEARNFFDIVKDQIKECRTKKKK